MVCGTLSRQVRFSQFKSKKDNFKIYKQILMDVDKTVNHTSTRLHLLQQRHQHLIDEINRKIEI